MTAEQQRLLEHRQHKANWRLWGPYLSDRAWGTVRESSSTDKEVWSSVTYEQAADHVYRWNEDGLGGVCDRDQYFCFAWGFWNGKDPLLKERLFGLTGPEGNHGEDIKECLFHLENSPTHSFMQMLYRYPQAEFPYAKLREENRRRNRSQPEYEIWETGAFDGGRFFDITMEYAKGAFDDLLIRLRMKNQSTEEAPLTILAQSWMRNTWSFGFPKGPMGDVSHKPSLRLENPSQLQVSHELLGDYQLYLESPPEEWLFTENEPGAKGAFHHYVVRGDKSKMLTSGPSTKAAALWLRNLKPGEEISLRLRLSKKALTHPFGDFDSIWQLRQQEIENFYQAIQSPDLDAEAKKIQRRAFAGLLFSRQLYYLDVHQWLRGDPQHPLSVESQRTRRNFGWEHLKAFDLLSMPDKWEYPYFCAWDMAFHCIPMVLLDPDFAKRQMVLMTREWFMHPSGQLPSYEWCFSDVNPPVHAWGCWRVYKIDAKRSGKPDRPFLEGVFHKLLLNFTWWVNRKDAEGNNLFQGGFLGMDNISVVDRSAPLPVKGRIDQSDGTAWMGFFSLLMMKMSLELAKEEPVYQDLASKFFEHFLRIASAMNDCGHRGHHLWDAQDGFFYDVLHLEDGKDSMQPLRIRSLVGLLALLSVETIDEELLASMPIFARRMEWLLTKVPGLSCQIERVTAGSQIKRLLVSIVSKGQLLSVLRYMLDQTEFLSPFGIRSLSRYHQEHPFVLEEAGHHYHIGYEPGMAETGLFGGNSNWRGPIWFPTNFLLIESLQKFHHYFGDSLKVECPTGSGVWMTLGEVATELSRRLTRLFLPDQNSHRPWTGNSSPFANDPLWKDLLLFHEFYHGETGEGLGASHQTGWTALIAKLLQQAASPLKP